MNEMQKLADKIEACTTFQGHCFGVDLTHSDRDLIVAALRAQAQPASPSCSDPNCTDPACNYDNEPAPAQAQGEPGFGRTNSAFHAALRKYPDAFEALHYFWNEGIASAAPPAPSDAGMRERCAEICETEAARWPAHVGSSARVAAMQIRALPASGEADPTCAKVQTAASLPVGMQEAKFLLDRLDEYYPEDDDHISDFHGHIRPAMCRLRDAIKR